MTAKMADILAWARQGQEMFSVDLEQILETVAAWEEGSSSTEQERVRGVAQITAARLQPGIACELADGRLSMLERRRLVLDRAKALESRSPTQIASILFSLDGLSTAERRRVLEAVGDDLDHWRKMGVLDLPAASPNGPIADLGLS
jgi:hypothetical protein